MADGLISTLLEKLFSTAYEYVAGEVKLVRNVTTEVEDFADKLTAIQAVLEDAERRQEKEARVKIWLDKLKKISLEMVDVLDEWNTDMLRQQVEQQEREAENAVVPEKKKVTFSASPSCFCFRKAKEVAFRHDIALKIKDLNDRLSVIDEQRRNTLVFQPNENGIQQVPKRQQTSHFVDMSTVFRREKEKDFLIKKLLSDGREEHRGVLVIPVLGMGGMGKTTLTQLVYNDGNVEAYFEKMVWVCVSDPFDVIKVAKAITGDNTPSSHDQLSHVLERMSKSIEGKRFLIVLDDVWTHDHEKWEQLRVPFVQNGAKGSRILVTTRQHDVVDTMRATSDMINLGELSNECCLSIFNHMAFFGGLVDESKFEDISKKLVGKCKGLPLAAKALGSLMRNKRTEKEWLGVLHSKTWDREEMEQQVFQPLLLSYYDLAPSIKSCLLYCASFPKDYEFERGRLIDLWMAQDYLNSKKNKDKGEIGETFFDCLVARSFFQDFKKDIYGKIMGCKMHDIVHDFVQFLTKNECLIFEAQGVGNEIEGLGEKVHHLTVVSEHVQSFQLSNAYHSCKDLRSYTGGRGFNFILRQKCLRTLNLSPMDCNLSFDINEVPKEIGELIHLRLIDLSGNVNLKILPDSICGLYNLYILRLDHCDSLEKLPDNMGKLISLKHFYVDGCWMLKYLPKGIRRLKNLKKIVGGVVPCGGDEDTAALQLGDLEPDIIEGNLTINYKGNLEDEREIEKAQLWEKKQLIHVTINYRGHARDNQTRSTTETLNVLRPHENLESLNIWFHSGNTWPSWLMSLHNLKKLLLFNWIECKYLPPLGKLPLLEQLSLGSMRKVKKVSGEFLGIDKDETSLTSSSSFFPKLKKLQFGLMDEWEEWEVGAEGWNKEGSEISIMPCLSLLTIQSCGSLKTLPDFLRKTPLRALYIHRCSRLADRCKQGSGEEWPKISHIPKIHFEIDLSIFH